jgi:ribosomal protein S18 acetylase RimI-like enzyme
MQFDAQTNHYHEHYPNAENSVIRIAGLPAGRLILNRSDSSLLIIDIALLPQFRNQGFGTAMLRDIMQSAQLHGLPVLLRVEFFNPVIRLYSRLGFVKTREVNAVYHEMIWPPEAAAGRAS